MTDQKRLPPPKRSRRSALKRQRMALLIGLGVVALLTIAFILVHIFTSRVLFEDVDGTKYYAVRDNGAYVLENEDGKAMPTNSDGLYITVANTLVNVDADSGKCTVVAVVLTADSIEITKFNYSTYSYDVLMYPQIEMNGSTDANCIQSIEIKNKFERETEDGGTETVEDHYIFYLNDKGEYVIKNCPGIEIDEVMFASIAVSTGYTRAVKRLDLSESNPHAEGFRQNGYAEYGLPETDAEGENYFIITSKAGTSYKVLIGDRAPDGSGYYARFAGRPDVYIISESETTDYSTAFSETFFAELEDYVVPNVVVPMTSSNYFDMQNFTIMELTGVTGNDWNNAAYRQIVQFSYIPIELRTGTINASRPYVGFIGDPPADGSEGKLSSGYHINYYNADDCLQNIQMMQGARVVWLDNGRDDTLDHISFTAKYGCQFAMNFTFVSERNGANYNYAPKTEVDQRIWISPKTEDDTYFVYSDFYDMVLEVEAIYFEFLEWQDVEWVEKDILSVHIGYVEKLEFTIGNGILVNGGKTHHVVLDFDNSETDQSATSDSYITTDLLKIFATYNNGTAHVSEQISTDLYRQLHLVLLYSSLEGDATLDPATQEAYRNAGDSAADLVIRMTLNEDGVSNTYTYRFYNYTARQTYVTVNGVGTSYMLHKQVDKIISDLGKLLSGTNIVYNAADGVCGCRGYAA